jgi:hypothetical protein
MKTPKLRYDGKFNWLPEGRQWTILEHFIDANGADRYKSSFLLQGLKDLGIVSEVVR